MKKTLKYVFPIFMVIAILFSACSSGSSADFNTDSGEATEAPSSNDSTERVGHITREEYKTFEQLVGSATDIVIATVNGYRETYGALKAERIEFLVKERFLGDESQYMLPVMLGGGPAAQGDGIDLQG